MFGRGKKRREREEAERARQQEQVEREALRFLDPYDSKTSFGSGAVLNMSQVFSNVEENLERIDMHIDPEQGVGLTDVLDQETLLALARTSGLGPMTLLHFVNTALDILQRRNPEGYSHLNPQHLDPEQFGFKVSPDSLDASKSLISLRLSRDEVQSGDVPAIDGADGDAFVEVLAALFTFFVMAVHYLPRTSGANEG